MENGGAPLGMIETQLRAWATELDRPKTKVEKQLAEVKTEYDEHSEELRDDIETQLKKCGKEPHHWSSATRSVRIRLCRYGRWDRPASP